MVKLSVLSFHETRSSIYMAKPSPDQQFEVECKFIAICWGCEPRLSACLSVFSTFFFLKRNWIELNHQKIPVATTTPNVKLKHSKQIRQGQGCDVMWCVAQAGPLSSFHSRSRVPGNSERAAYLALQYTVQYGTDPLSSLDATLQTQRVCQTRRFFSSSIILSVLMKGGTHTCKVQVAAALLLHGSFSG